MQSNVTDQFGRSRLAFSGVWALPLIDAYVLFALEKYKRIRTKLSGTHRNFIICVPVNKLSEQLSENLIYSKSPEK